MWRVYVREHPTFGSWYHRIERQPGWVSRIAVTAAVLVVVVPLVLLALAAITVGLVVFVTLGLIAQLVVMVRGVFVRGGMPSVASGASGGGRRNVRVLRDD
ncbi:MAG: hypothetical protein V3U29_01980 [Phycisphaeraceae bacterium]